MLGALRMVDPLVRRDPLWAMDAAALDNRSTKAMIKEV
jgi:hypothetical protein